MEDVVQDKCVAKFWHDNHQNWAVIQNMLANGVLLKLASKYINSIHWKEDSFTWKLCHLGSFSIKIENGAQFRQHNDGDDEQDDAIPPWKELWKIKTIERLCLFCWLLFYNRVLMKTLLAHHGLANILTCQGYNEEDETRIHLF